MRPAPTPIGDRPPHFDFRGLLCDFRRVKRSDRGSTSRSFIIVLALVVIAGLGYVAWTFVLHPDPYAVSERVARDARRGVAAEVRDFQRQVDSLEREARQSKKDVSADIDKHMAAALRGIDDVVAAARDRLSDLDIGIRTQRNRMDRIEGRADEAREMVRELAEETKQKVTGGDAAK